MRILKIMLITLVLGSLGVVSLSCGSKSDSSKSDSASAPQIQTATIKRGNLSVDIAGSSNLALSLTEDLAFEVAGTVEEVMVETGDTVTKGEVLVKLDKSDWEDEMATLQRSLTQAQIDLENAKYNLNQAQNPTSTSGRVVEVDPLNVATKQLQVQLAQAKLRDAQKALDEALASSPEITAPFDGFVTAVNVEGGDEVTKGTVAVTVADPNKFEAETLVSEMDIFQVKLGGDATVSVTAISGVSIPAKVTHISPTATIQSGVVNYKVKVELQPLQSVQLKDGLTVTVSILVVQKKNVLLVPNAAIISQGGQSYVQVVSSTGATERRAIKTGVTDYTNTEVTEGLSEGEKVIVPQGTTTTTTTQQQGSSGGIMIPGLGR